MEGTTQTPYEMWTQKTPKVSYFHAFKCIYYKFNDKDHLRKFDK